MINFLIGFIVTIVSLVIGYLLGSTSNTEDRLTVRKVRRFIDKTNPFKDQTVGAVPRPTAQDVMYKDKPWLKEEDDSMSELLDGLQNK